MSSIAGRLLGTTVSGRIVRLVVVVQVLWLICVAIIASNARSVSSTEKQQRQIFAAYAAERAAYAGWLTDDDQSNMAAALAALRDPSQRALLKTTWDQVQQGYREAHTNLDELSRLVPAGLRPAVAQASSDLNAYNGFTEQVGQALFTAQDPIRAVKVMTVDNAATSNRTQAAFDSVGAAVAREANRLSQAADSKAASTVTWILALAPLILVLSTLATFLLLRTITRALNRLRGVARKVSQGELDHAPVRCGQREIDEVSAAFDDVTAYLTTTAEAADEISGGNLDVEVTPLSERDRLGLAFARMRAKLVEMMREITVTSQHVADASKQVAVSSDEAGRAVGEIATACNEVAQGVTRQALSVESARSGTEQVVSSAELSAERVRETQRAAADASEVAAAGVEAAERASQAMHAVREATLSATQQIQELGRKSEAIGDIVVTIAGIADQTNLLALNAAIEAARAGEQGRGFAVVADEVRQLAESARRAAGDIEQLINEMQRETVRAVEAVETGAQRTEEGVDTVEDARRRFEAIGSSVADMNTRIDDVTGAIEEITAATQQILADVSELAASSQQSSASTEQVASSTQETSASTEEIAASAHDLAGVAQRLDAMMAQFTLTRA